MPATHNKGRDGGGRGKEVSSKVRMAFEKMIARIEGGEVPGVTDMSDIMLELATSSSGDFLKLLDTVAKYVPKEMMIETDTTVRLISGDPMSADEWEASYATEPEQTSTTH